MAANRKLPFGYRMEFGEVVIHSAEAAVVQEIFRQYISGESYRSLVDSLRNQDVPYYQGKLWNKNMVARILENRKYTGEQGWPFIIPEEQYDRVNEKRATRVTPPKKTEAQKILRRLCSGGSAADTEQTVLRMLNGLIAAPEQIHAQEIPEAGTPQINDLRQALKKELEQQPVNEETAKGLALELASAQYTAIGDQEYETIRLRRLFGQHTPLQELDAALLRSTVSAVGLRRGKVFIRLKNNQILEGSQ